MSFIKKKYLILLCVLSALLLSLSWPLNGFPFLVFISLVPLIIVIEEIKKNPDRFTALATLRYSYITFLIWNALTTWWIWHSTVVGALIAIFVNSLFMAIVVQIAAFVRGKLENNIIGIAIFPIFWIAFEYLHQLWDLSWSWLNLGNVFASHTAWVQWYEYTGIHGGSLWIILVNILIYFLIKPYLYKQPATRKNQKAITIFLVLALIIPAAASLIRYYTYKERHNPVNIVVLQPNLDPYKEEYQLTVEQVIDRLFSDKAISLIDTNTNFIIAPESVLQEGLFEDEFAYSKSIKSIKEILKTHSPQAHFISGASTFRMLKPYEPKGPSARRYNKDDDLYYEAFNTALFMDSMAVPQTYHKSKLVPGVEQMPFSEIIKPIENLAIDLGGTVGSLGKSAERVVYKKSKIPVSAIICYESIYGEFTAEFVKNGAQLIFIITNDGWWENTPGHKQHFAYAKLRAVETRRSIARSANTGISCFINQRGDVIEKTSYWTRDVIKNELNANDEITFYVKHGDYIGKSFTFISILLIFIAILMFFAKKKTSLKNKISK